MVYAKKSLSQNFLIDEAILQAVIDLSSVRHGDLVLEVGPGRGALTTRLLDRGCHVLAIEKDACLAQELRNRKLPRLTVIEQDILKWSVSEIEGKKISLVSSLPYNITTPFFEMFLPRYHLIESMTLVIQKEVADKIVAEVGSRAYGFFTLFVRSYVDSIHSFSIPPIAFSPIPKVWSTALRLTLRKPTSNLNESSFFSILKAAFAHKRKMLKSSLQSVCSKEKVIEALKTLNLSLESRPHELSLASWIDFSAILCSDAAVEKNR